MHSDSELSPVTSQHGQKPPSDLYGSNNISHRRTTARRRYLPHANQYSKPRAITSSGFGDRAYREIIDKAAAQKPDRLICSSFAEPNRQPRRCPLPPLEPRSETVARSTGGTLQRARLSRKRKSSRIAHGCSQFWVLRDA